MRMMITAEPTTAAADALDAQPGGPGALFREIGERFRPEAFYPHAARRAATWVIDVADGPALAELFHFLLARTGATPTVVPVLSALEAKDALPAAISRARGGSN